jgi:hypothetical protein
LLIQVTHEEKKHTPRQCQFIRECASHHRSGPCASIGLQLSFFRLLRIRSPKSGPYRRCGAYDRPNKGGRGGRQFPSKRSGNSDPNGKSDRATDQCVWVPSEPCPATNYGTPSHA